MSYNYKERSYAPTFSIKSLWGLSKSAELGLDDEALYSIIHRETGKDSMRKLTQNEAYKKEKASLVGYGQFLDENAWQYFGSKIIELVTKTK